MARFTILLFLWLATAPAAGADTHQAANPLEVAHRLLDRGGAAIDFAHAALLVDTLIDPGADEAATLAEIERMAATIRRMLASLPVEDARKDGERMRALRTFLYEDGWWNGGKTFQYDHSDPFGRDERTRLLSTYLATRKGNCVSMPLLVLALGERLDL